MTLEFRQMVYRWRHDADKNAAKKDCIIYQLQKLFATLQLISSNLEEENSAKDTTKQPEQVEDSTTAKHSANFTRMMQLFADTTDLTKSFQWDY